mmetsp:Transcript_24660/g.78078  ORF Transcript_24660/g.78078 Transcript_24660/m.78078 type:complete len:509 (-) Transcript_24660:28-1554(-)
MGSTEDKIRRLARTVEESRDAVGLCQAAVDLRAYLTGPDLSRAALEAAAGAASSLGRHFLAGGECSASAREAASEVLAALYDVARADLCDRDVICKLLLAKNGRDLRTDDGLWPTLWGLLRGQGSGDGCDLAFVHACELLACLAAGQPHLCRSLCGAGLLDAVAARLLLATNGRRGVPTVALLAAEPREVAPMGDGWLFWASAVAVLLEVLLLEEDPALFTAGVPTPHRPIWDQGGQPRQSQVVLDALVAALERSLVRDRGCLVVQHLHLSGLRALGQLVRICRGQVFLSSSTHRSGKWHVEPAVRHLLASGAVALAAHVMRLAGSTDEQGTAVALWFLAEVSEGAPTERTLRVREGFAEVAIAALASRAVSAWPKSQTVLREAQRVLRASGAAGDEDPRSSPKFRPWNPGDGQALTARRSCPDSALAEGRGACLASEALHNDSRGASHEPLQVLPRLAPLLAPVLRSPESPAKQRRSPLTARVTPPWRAWQPSTDLPHAWALHRETY